MFATLYVSDGGACPRCKVVAEFLQQHDIHIPIKSGLDIDAYMISKGIWEYPVLALGFSVGQWESMIYGKIPTKWTQRNNDRTLFLSPAELFYDMDLAPVAKDELLRIFQETGWYNPCNTK